MPTPTPQFNQYWKFAQQSMPGGVSSSLRINPFNNRPMYLSKADGPFVNSGSEATLADALGLLAEAARETVAQMD